MDFKPYKKISHVRCGRVLFSNFDIEVLFDNLQKDMLFLRFFGLKKNSPRFDEVNYEFEEIKKEIVEKGYLTPKGVYGIYRVSSSKRLILVYTDKGVYDIPLETNSNGVSIGDFLLDDDYVAFTSVSCFVNDDVVYGYIKHDDFKKLYMINSINIMLAEAFTEVLHYLAAKDMGIDVVCEMKELYLHKNPGRRYSPGYRGLDISVNRTIHEILGAYELGSKITESGMIEPESSVQCLIVFNDKAFYL